MLYHLARRRSRAHKILFSPELPFKPKKVESKVNYQRKVKHPQRQQEG